MVRRRQLRHEIAMLVAVTLFLFSIHFTMLDDNVYRQITDIRVFRSPGSPFGGYPEDVVKRLHGNVTMLSIQDLYFIKKHTTPASGSKFETKVDSKAQKNIKLKSNAIDSGQSNSAKSRSAAFDKDSPVTHNNKTTFKEYDISKVRLEVLTDDIPVNFTWFKIEGYNSLYSPLINNEKLCQLPNGARPFLLIVVPSVRGNTKTRDVIRSTWANLVYNGGYWAGQKVEEPVRLMFLLGGAEYSEQFKDEIKRENEKHGDIVVSDFVDSYRNLSTKVAVALHWATEFCDGVGHLVKVDEDTFVHVPQLIKSIKIAEKKSKKFVLGHPNYSSKVARSGKWKVGSEYPLPDYPRYVYGHSYVISGPAIRPILTMYQEVPVIPNEDAFFTGILPKLSNVTRFGSSAIARIRNGREVLCDVARGYLISVTLCCDDHLLKLYHDAIHKECDNRSLSLYPVCWCRFYKELSDELYSKNLC